MRKFDLELEDSYFLIYILRNFTGRSNTRLSFFMRIKSELNFKFCDQYFT